MCMYGISYDTRMHPNGGAHSHTHIVLHTAACPNRFHATGRVQCVRCTQYWTLFALRQVSYGGRTRFRWGTPYEIERLVGRRRADDVCLVWAHVMQCYGEQRDYVTQRHTDVNELHFRVKCLDCWFQFTHDTIFRCVFCLCWHIISMHVCILTSLSQHKIKSRLFIIV